MSEIANRGAQAPFADYHATNRPWRLLLPPIYRYLPSKYVDAFFESGELRLSSFSQFKKHSDEARSDSDEGRSMVGTQGGGRSFFAFIVGGMNSYVLCGSYILSKSIMDKFSGCDSAIEITNVPDFSLCIARQLAGFTSGISGHCIYSGSRILQRKTESDPFPLTEKEKNEGIGIGRMFAAAADAGQGEELFLKPRAYAYQAEYRLIWNIDTTPQDFISLKSPDARQYCRKVHLSEIV